jgi:[ribosomal protein S5]-alanine N-acetyltransferase
MKTKPVLEGPSIYLEGLSEKHVSERYAGWLGSKEICRENRHGLARASVDTVRAYVKSVDKDEKNVVFAITAKKGNFHIGNITIGNILQEDKSGEISILIGERDFWGRGIATEAYKLIIDYGFNTLDLHRLYSGMTVRNKAMIRVAEKCGMKPEGTFKEAFLKEGEYLDVVQYALINPKHGRGPVR